MDAERICRLPWTFALLLCAGSPGAAESPSPPNLLFVQTDYQRGVDDPSLGNPFLIMPTLILLAGGTIPNTVEGEDLTPMLKDPAATVTDYAVMECTLVTSIITDKWKMAFHHFNRETDLYDLENDARELKNLAGQPEYAEIERQLAAQLVQWRRQLNPNARIPADPYQWRACLGPNADIWRAGYMKQYARLIELEGRPGKTGRRSVLRETGAGCDDYGELSEPARRPLLPSAPPDSCSAVMSG